MPASVHKILLHGSEIISAALLPIGQLSEEAQKARNKDLKKFPESLARKSREREREREREEANNDLMRRFLVTSDPVISAMRCLPIPKKISLTHEGLQMLDSPSTYAPSMETESSGEEEIDGL
jgi:hypothetical protein